MDVVLSQSEACELFLPLLRDKGVDAVRELQVYARPLVDGEQLESLGFIGDTEGAMVVRFADGHERIVRGPEFVRDCQACGIESGDDKCQLYRARVKYRELRNAWPVHINSRGRLLNVIAFCDLDGIAGMFGPDSVVATDDFKSVFIMNAADLASVVTGNAE